MGIKRTADGISSTGISPRPMLVGAPRNAVWAFNAGVSLAYVPLLMSCQLSVLMVLAHSWNMRSWRIHRRGTYRMCPLPYTAPVASHRAFFFKVQPQPRGNGNRERVSCFRCRGRFSQFILTIEWMSLISSRRFMYSSTRTRGWPSGS